MPRVDARFVPIAVSACLFPIGAWAQPAAGASSPVPGTPPDWFVYTVIGVIFFCALVTLFVIRAAVSGSKWSLADALSEEADVTAMKGAAGQQEPIVDSSGKPMLISELRASSSRLVALMGMLVILFMFLGFGTFALYRFAISGNMPADTDKVINFLAAGLTLFAPYLVNKFSSLFEGLIPKR